MAESANDGTVDADSGADSDDSDRVVKMTLLIAVVVMKVAVVMALLVVMVELMAMVVVMAQIAMTVIWR